MTRDELKETFERQAEWRRQKADDYPDDGRNLAAAATFDRLAATAADIPQHVLNAYEATLWRWDDSKLVEVEREALRQVGFRSEPENAEAFVRGVLESVAWVHVGEEYRPQAV
jgi:hypothetical protein